MHISQNLARIITNNLALSITIAGNLSLTACSGIPSTDQEAATRNTSESIGAPQCATGAPDLEVQGGILTEQTSDGLHHYAGLERTITALPWGYNSPVTYTNPDCYKALLIKIDKWQNGYADLRVQPSESLLGAGTHASNQADCEALEMKAYLYPPDGYGPPILRDEFGEWIENPNTNKFLCKEPELIFGGSTWRVTGWDTFAVGQTYQLAATYRAPDPTVTLAINVSSPPLACGEAGKKCCPQPNAAGPCLPGNICNVPNDQCQACGISGAPACPGAGSGSCMSDDLAPVNGVCQPCGKLGKACCTGNDRYQGRACNTSLICSSGSCITPPSPVTSAPPMQINQLTCSGQTATKATANHLVRYQYSDTNCGDLASEFANTDAEAQQCVLNQFAAIGRSVTIISGSQMLQPYSFCVCSYGGASTSTIEAFSQNAANSCINSLMIGAFQIGSGTCTAAEETSCE